MLKLPQPFRKQGQQLCSDGNTTVFFDAYNVDQMHDAYQQGLAEQPERVPLSEAEVTDIAIKWSNSRFVAMSDRFVQDFARELLAAAAIKQGGQND